jgi:hypothetical protein
MTEKRIKNEQWYVKELISKIENNKIKKPKFQRKKKWDVKPKNENVPNERSYIDFLFKKRNSVHAITFGQETLTHSISFSNIDGNNRINAIQHFMEKPFEIFDDYLDELFQILDNFGSSNRAEIKNIFTSLSYKEFICIARLDKFFKSIKKNELFDEIQKKQNEIDDEIEKIQKKLKINEKENFDSTVQISVNIFEGYNTDELSETFEEINKFNSTLTETELLACRLHNVNDFIISDNVFITRLENSIKEYYEYKSVGEVLECHHHEAGNINAYDFIVGFQNLKSKDCKFISATDADGLSLFFKLYKALYGCYETTFTTENVNDFIRKITYSCEIMNRTISKIFTETINDTLFNKSCKQKLGTLKKNNLFMLITSIIGYSKKETDDDIIIKSLEKCLLYHFLVSDLKETNTREDFKNYDSITYRAGGKFVENVVKNVLNDPTLISHRLNKELFGRLLECLYIDTNTPDQRKLDNGNNKNDKRRQLKFFEKTLMFYYFKEKLPTNMLDNDFSIEHIFPNSSDWDGELDKDRTGNLIPLISSMNSSRGNRHIKNYNETDQGKEYCKFIKDIIPINEYDNVISHDDRKPKITDNDLYNKLCARNENTYKNSFINCLFE